MDTNKKGGCSRPPLSCSNDGTRGNAIPRNKYKEKRIQLKELTLETDYSIIRTHIGIPPSHTTDSTQIDKMKTAS